jgi:transcriptional regulator with XRE-family HTH domain
MPPRGFGQNVRQLRLQRGFTLRALAAECGYGAPMIVAIEKGRQLPSVGRLLLLARALDTSIDALFEGVR